MSTTERLELKTIAVCSFSVAASEELLYLGTTFPALKTNWRGLREKQTLRSRLSLEAKYHSTQAIVLHGAQATHLNQIMERSRRRQVSVELLRLLHKPIISLQNSAATSFCGLQELIVVRMARTRLDGWKNIDRLS